jgi:hypothetical protein
MRVCWSSLGGTVFPPMSNEYCEKTEKQVYFKSFDVTPKFLKSYQKLEILFDDDTM